MQDAARYAARYKLDVPPAWSSPLASTPLAISIGTASLTFPPALSSVIVIHGGRDEGGGIVDAAVRGGAFSLFAIA